MTAARWVAVVALAGFTPATAPATTTITIVATALLLAGVLVAAGWYRLSRA